MHVASGHAARQRRALALTLALPLPVVHHGAVTEYALRAGEEAVGRLQLLARVHRPATEALVDRIGVREGQAWLDLGCGVGDVSRLLAGRRARVTAVDADERAVEAARAGLADFGGAVEVRVSRAQELSDVARFDVAYARCLLSHLAARDDVLARMVRAVRAGGVVAVEDVDFSGAFCHPACPAFDRYCELYRAVVVARGGDPLLGRALASMLARVGLADVEALGVQPAFVAGEGKAMPHLTLEHLRESIVSASLATGAEIDALAAELRAFEALPHSLVAMPRVVQAWGRVT
jgi:SAM-dependent methyltransferase